MVLIFIYWLISYKYFWLTTIVHTNLCPPKSSIWIEDKYPSHYQIILNSIYYKFQNLIKIL